MAEETPAIQPGRGAVRYTLSYGPSPEKEQRWKQTSPGWPDPSDWINRLYASLEGYYEVYKQEPDALLRRNKAGARRSISAHAAANGRPAMYQPKPS